ncbi:GcrA-like regulator [Bradyrhizobium lablabi]|uniref:GcrA family cell cycle regulator n=1 Tax=Bradyrhizobium lablabi TaxID=722472 RepID=UPI001BA76713|nr:GcrA family cell cycle regulator [Bradyrhizobium lablabi]MBR1120584.1 GcrA-like regulator [Bradyrhizobium lablabi]
MFANLPTWTDERIELLKTHFQAGLSCRQIAVDIGVSRNAVIGKLSRLGLTRGRTISAESRAKKPAKERGTARSVPRLQYQLLKALYEDPLSLDGPVVSERRCSLFELSKERCRWPISTPGAEDFCFCGNLPLDGQPYCLGHTRLAYRPSARPRAARV